MTTTATATISNDVSYTLLTTGGGQTQNESASLSYSQALSNATGVAGPLEINYALIASGNIDPSDKYYFDFQALEKQVFNTTSNIQFSAVKAVAIENTRTGYGEDFKVFATGANSFTNIFNGGSGNLLIKPYAVWSYADPISGTTVSASNRILGIENIGTETGTWQLVVAGVTG